MIPVIRLHPQRHKRVALGHPWIYSNEIVMDDAARALAPGTLAAFEAQDGARLGVGSFNPRTLIAGRIFTRGAGVEPDAAWIRARIAEALEVRRFLGVADFGRLIHAEADGLPGLVVDRFGPHLGVQLNTAGMEKLWPLVEAALVEALAPASIVLHNESPSRTLEGLERSVTVARGDPGGPVEVEENGIVFFADLVGGQKTGWYYDQRDNHALVAGAAAGRRALDLYCHGGGFGLTAARAGAESVLGVDSSQPALDLAARAAARNGLESRCVWRRADAFEELERLGKAGETFGVVVADPPPFVRSRKDLASGARGYRKLARLAARVVAPGGFLFIASCSHNMTLDAFTDEVARGLVEARRRGRILRTVFAAPDHPVHPGLPETAYLKGLFLRVDDGVSA